MTTTRVCAVCGTRLSMPRRVDAVTCSPRCRQQRSRLARRAAADTAAGVPVQLRETARWVRWARVRRGDRVTKVPRTIAGRAASVTDPGTWASHEAAAASGVGEGLGFVLSDVDDVTCVDLDHCLDGAGRLSAGARELLAAAPGTWVEVSPSGDGLHVWGRAGALERGRRLVTASGVAVEVYGSGRYMTVTGVVFEGAPLVLGDLRPLLALVGVG